MKSFIVFTLSLFLLVGCGEKTEYDQYGEPIIYGKYFVRCSSLPGHDMKTDSSAFYRDCEAGHKEALSVIEDDHFFDEIRNTPSDKADLSISLPAGVKNPNARAVFIITAIEDKVAYKGFGASSIYEDGRRCKFDKRTQETINRSKNYMELVKLVKGESIVVTYESCSYAEIKAISATSTRHSDLYALDSNLNITKTTDIPYTSPPPSPPATSPLGTAPSFPAGSTGNTGNPLGDTK